MSKEYVELSLEEIFDIASAHMEEDDVHAQIVVDFAADIEKEVLRRCRAQGGITSENITQAAANKAAQEGGLPELPEKDLLTDQGSEGLVYYYGYADDVILSYARQAIAADRASRQVANKAEVEPFNVEHFGYLLNRLSLANRRDGWTTNDPWKDRDAIQQAKDAVDLAEKNITEYVRLVLATPPATTGASTVLTDERIDDDDGMFSKDWECGYSMGFEAAKGLFAAQAGQVAVPEGWKLVPVEPTNMMLQNAAANPIWPGQPTCAKHAWKRMLAVAPSPAKESK